MKYEEILNIYKKMNIENKWNNYNKKDNEIYIIDDNSNFLNVNYEIYER